MAGARFRGQVERTEFRGNAARGRYGDSDPASWGWRRPDFVELRMERELARLELELDPPSESRIVTPGPVSRLL
jgi:hypothetical protein